MTAMEMNQSKKITAQVIKSLQLDFSEILYKKEIKTVPCKNWRLVQTLQSCSHQNPNAIVNWINVLIKKFRFKSAFCLLFKIFDNRSSHLFGPTWYARKSMCVDKAESTAYSIASHTFYTVSSVSLSLSPINILVDYDSLMNLKINYSNQTENHLHILYNQTHCGCRIKKCVQLEHITINSLIIRTKV